MPENDIKKQNQSQSESNDPNGAPKNIQKPKVEHKPTDEKLK